MMMMMKSTIILFLGAVLILATLEGHADSTIRGYSDQPYSGSQQAQGVTGTNSNGVDGNNNGGTSSPTHRYFKDADSSSFRKRSP